MRPPRGARDDVAQLRHHLAAIADPERETVRAFKKIREHLLQAVIEQDRLRPATPRTKHVPVGETAAGRQSAKVREICSAREEIAHVYIDGCKACAIKGRGHLYLAIHALLPQDRNTWSSGMDERRAHSL